MIRNDSEYREALRRIESERQSLAEHEAKLKGMGFSPEEVARGMSPLEVFHQQFVEKVEDYARAKRGDLGGFREVRDLGRLLIAARIASGMSQRALAQKLGVNESQVSRDERNEYSSVTLERTCLVLEAVGAEVTLKSRIRRPASEDLVLQMEYEPRRDRHSMTVQVDYSPRLPSRRSRSNSKKPAA